MQVDLFGPGESVAVDGKRGRGRPRLHASNAAKQAAYRARKGLSVTVQLDEETKAGLDAYMARQHADGAALDLSQVVAKLIRAQLLRKR